MPFGKVQFGDEKVDVVQGRDMGSPFQFFLKRRWRRRPTAREQVVGDVQR